MTDLEKFIEAFQKMDKKNVKSILDKTNPEDFDDISFDVDFIFSAFTVMEALGNTELKLSKKYYRVFSAPNMYSNKMFYHHRCKFIGNKTKQHISIFINICDDIIVSWHDCTNVKNKLGEVPINDLQIICVPFDYMRCSTPNCPSCGNN